MRPGSRNTVATPRGSSMRNTRTAAAQTAFGTQLRQLPGDSPAVAFNVWRSRCIPGLEIVQTNVHEHSYPPHLHDSVEILWVRSGCGRLFCQGRQIDILTGEAVVVPANEVHSGGATRPDLEYVAIHLPSLLLQQVFEEDGLETELHPRPLVSLSQEKASSLLPILVRTLCADLPQNQLNFILRPILSQILEAPTVAERRSLRARTERHPAVSKAQSIIRAGCADGVHISHLARRVDLDTRYLISLFKLATGLTPHQFQISLRVELARLLIEQSLPLCDVAMRAGFADQSHLNRHFRRQYGLTPGAFRESVFIRSSIEV
jgi:AraC-like DNA-binding protein/mannose-6-phosphate isomerase-like protein (cupin superfamily)